MVSFLFVLFCFCIFLSSSYKCKGDCVKHCNTKFIVRRNKNLLKYQKNIGNRPDLLKFKMIFLSPFSLVGAREPPITELKLFTTWRKI